MPGRAYDRWGPGQLQRVARLRPTTTGRQLLPQAGAARSDPGKVPDQAQEPAQGCGDAGPPIGRSSTVDHRPGGARPGPNPADLQDPGQAAVDQGLAVFACEGIEPVRGGAATRGSPVAARRGRDPAGARAGLRRGRVRPAAHGRRRPSRARDSSRSPPTTRRSCPGLRADSTRGKRFHGDQHGPGLGRTHLHNRIRRGEAAALRGHRPQFLRSTAGGRPTASCWPGGHRAGAVEAVSAYVPRPSG